VYRTGAGFGTRWTSALFGALECAVWSAAAGAFACSAFYFAFVSWASSARALDFGLASYYD
jgi:hypothetical protein